MKQLFSALFILLCHGLFSNVTVYFNYNVFNTISSKPYLETSLTIAGTSVKFLPVAGGNQASVNISWRILKNGQVVKSSAYNLKSPKVIDTHNLPSFIDNQRFALDNGAYILELSIADNAFPDKKTSHTEKIVIDLKRENKIYSSEIQALDSYVKSTQQGPLTKNGYDLVPYNINYYPKAQNALRFYFEAYNIDSVLGKQAKFLFSYYVENGENFAKVAALNNYQKQPAQRLNALLGQFDISTLPSGNYNLVVEVKDSANKVQAQKKWFFQRQSDAPQMPDELADKSIRTIEDFFNSFQSTDSLKQFVECLWPRSSTKEREWQQVTTSKKDPNLMRSYAVEYWKKEAGDSLNPLKIWLVYYQSVKEANALLKCGKQKGYFTDRGRVYLQYGKPDQRNQVNSEPNTYPYEIWQYYRVYDKATGRFFTNKKFVFVNEAIADNCYKLIHSDVRGEIYDERWRFRLVNRSQQSQNIDDTKPANTYGTNVDENFNNPR
jgi:GWxTD domain-containing protein